jgi:hypothetical protein
VAGAAGATRPRLMPHASCIGPYACLLSWHQAADDASRAAEREAVDARRRAERDGDQVRASACGG